MFNPKINNLLDDQLAVSGLEMGVVITPALALAGVSAASSIVGGIFGAKQKSKENSANKKAYKKQKKFNKKIAKKTNKQNEKLDAAKKANYYAMQNYSYDSSIQNWQTGIKIQDFKYLQALKQYQKSISIGSQQLGLNAEAMAQGVQAEQDALDEAFIQYNFEQQNNLSALKQTYVEGSIQKQEEGVKLVGIKNNKTFGQLTIQNTVDQLLSQNALKQETEMVNNLVSEGQIQLRQSGKSSARAQQSNKAALHRSLMALESELSGKKKQAAIQLAQLNVDTTLSEIGVGINFAKIDNAIKDAEETAETNLKVLDANLESQTKTTLNNIKQIGLEKQFADINTTANIMLLPEQLPYDPVPIVPPEQIFVDSMEAEPGFVPPPVMQNVWAPVISGISQGASVMTNPSLYTY
tara:strand:+ start:441 stop:1667 length:1227 start_codon:yes stop_codon:yes gene_type:complete